MRVVLFYYPCIKTFLGAGLFQGKQGSLILQRTALCSIAPWFHIRCAILSSGDKTYEIRVTLSGVPCKLDIFAMSRKQVSYRVNSEMPQVQDDLSSSSMTSLY